MKEKIELPEALICLYKRIIPLNEIYNKKKYKLPPSGGLYCFWWIGKKDDLLSANRTIEFKGSGGRWIRVEFKNWFPVDLPAIPLYIGKATKIQNRVRQHLLLNRLNRVHPSPIDFKKRKPKTPSCQLRVGIEHIFPDKGEILDFILKNIGISYVKLSGDNFLSERFYLEDFAIGYFRPWFNLDSER